MKSLYLECNRGISGDMAVAALLDAGADQKVLLKALNSIKAEGFKVEISRVKKNGIDVQDFNVILDKEFENHDHDMEYLFGKAESENGSKNSLHESDHSAHSHSPLKHEEEHNLHTEHSHSHTQEIHVHSHEDQVHEDTNSSAHESHSHDHSDHSHDHHGHHHFHRGMKEIAEIINSADLTEGARLLALKIFSIIAEAESKAHGISVDQVHFHELGALDSIVDVIALAVCFDNLNPDQVYVPYLCEGNGTVRCQHGILSVPVPAVANIIQSSRINLKLLDEHGEFVTPTGAAFVAAVKTQDRLPETFTINRIGLGAGKRNYSVPSILRAFIIEENSSTKDCIYKLESNIDDCTGEALGFILEELMAEGARDVHYIPCFMKKNRPGYLLNVICEEEKIPLMEDIIFRNTTTIGIRRVKMERTKLSRKAVSLDTQWGKVSVKSMTLNGLTKNYPEYEDVAALCRKQNLPFSETYSKIKALADSFITD